MYGNKLREWYTFNNKLEPMSVTDRSLWLLQYFNIELKPEVWKNGVYIAKI